MGPGQLDIVREVLDAVSRDFDAERLLELTDPEVEWRSFFAALLLGGEYHGHEGLRRYVRDMREAWEDLHVEVHGMVEAGEIVVATGRLRYRGRESGVTAEQPAGWMFRFREGKVVRFRAFRDPERALEAVGLDDRLPASGSA